MGVFVVCEIGYDSCTHLAAFDSEEKAKAYMDTLPKDAGAWTYYDISELEVR